MGMLGLVAMMSPQLVHRDWMSFGLIELNSWQNSCDMTVAMVIKSFLRYTDKMQGSCI